MTLGLIDVCFWVLSLFLSGLTVGLWIADRRHGKELRRMSNDLVALRCRAEKALRR